MPKLRDGVEVYGADTELAPEQSRPILLQVARPLLPFPCNQYVVNLIFWPILLQGPSNLQSTYDISVSGAPWI